MKNGFAGTLWLVLHSFVLLVSRSGEAAGPMPFAVRRFDINLFFNNDLPVLRMKKLLLFLAAGLLSVCCASAQDKGILNSLQRDVPGQGKVTIHQDARIAALVGSDAVPVGVDGSRVIKKAGYRIQVYAGNNTRAAKNEAHAVATRLKTLFPDLPVYTTFNPPRWLCRAGDFSTIEEADAVMRQLRAVGDFKAVSIVREQINIPL